MLRDKIADFYAKTKPILTELGKNAKKYTRYIRLNTDSYSSISRYVFVLSVLALLFLYYPLGALLSEKIERNTDIDINSSIGNQSQTINMVSYLVNQEVNEKIWTPNLPFFFPAAILDNMPNYQLGMMNGISKFTTAFEKRLDKNIADKENNSDLYRAATMLRYSGTIWMFDPNNKIKPVPSASSQYRKARRKLNKYNQELAIGVISFKKNIDDLIFILKNTNENLAQSSNQLTAWIRENSTNWIDLKADDKFYYNQGKAYAYYMLLKALGLDYQEIIVNNNQYQTWISLIKALQDACLIQPRIVRNAELSSSLAPNHLMYLNNYLLKAQNVIAKLIRNLNEQKKVF